jgi:hypothetical protein
MSTRDERIRAFFLRYQEGANTFDPDLVTSQFTSHFMDAGPRGVMTFENDERFAQAVREREPFMRGIGFRDAKVLEIEPTTLSDNYSLVRVRWSMWFAPDGRDDLVAEFLIDYLVSITDEAIKVAAYISHDDEEETMRQYGLID